MLRFTILVSAVPLMIAAFPARIELALGSQPCVAVGDETLQIATVSGQADLHVDLTNDPAAPLIVAASSAHRHLAPASL